MCKQQIKQPSNNVRQLAFRKFETGACDFGKERNCATRLLARERERERESLLAQILKNFIQIKAKALGHRKKPVKQVSLMAVHQLL